MYTKLALLSVIAVYAIMFVPDTDCACDSSTLQKEWHEYICIDKNRVQLTFHEEHTSDAHINDALRRVSLEFPYKCKAAFDPRSITVRSSQGVMLFPSEYSVNAGEVLLATVYSSSTSGHSLVRNKESDSYVYRLEDYAIRISEGGEYLHIGNFKVVLTQGCNIKVTFTTPTEFTVECAPSQGHHQGEASEPASEDPGENKGGRRR